MRQPAVVTARIRRNYIGLHVDGTSKVDNDPRMRYYPCMESDHPGEAELEAFATGNAPTDEDIRIDEHVKDCQQCLRRTLAFVRAKRLSLDQP